MSRRSLRRLEMAARAAACANAPSHIELEILFLAAVNAATDEELPGVLDRFAETRARTEAAFGPVPDAMLEILEDPDELPGLTMEEELAANPMPPRLPEVA